jgi:hypothetical protein
VPKADVDKIIANCKDHNWSGFGMLEAYKEKWELIWG